MYVVQNIPDQCCIHGAEHLLQKGQTPPLLHGPLSTCLYAIISSPQCRHCSIHGAEYLLQKGQPLPLLHRPLSICLHAIVSSPQYRHYSTQREKAQSHTCAITSRSSIRECILSNTTLAKEGRHTGQKQISALMDSSFSLLIKSLCSSTRRTSCQKQSSVAEFASAEGFAAYQASLGVWPGLRGPCQGRMIL